MAQWIYSEPDKDSVKKLMESLQISRVLASLLVKLNICCPSDASYFINPRLNHLEDPFLITNLSKATDRILAAIHNQEPILILGDYDVDGVTSTALLAHILNYLGATPHFVIPRRLEEGYGLTQAVIQRALNEFSPKLFIALDCGTNSTSEVQFLLDRNIDTLIIDHHQSKHHVPENAILVNPHVFDESHKPWATLCTVGLVFKVIHGIFKKLKASKHPKADSLKIKDLLDFVALGTVADLVPLKGENRILTTFGLQRIQIQERPGIRALAHVSRIGHNVTIYPSDVAFKLGPRINASGRLSDATLPVKMLLDPHYESCLNAANQLESFNRERQTIEQKVAEEAEHLIVSNNLHTGPAIVIYSPNWHAGVVGIVAGKLARKFHRPTIVLGKEGLLAKGSGRSIPGVNLVQALSDCAHLLETWGGHPAAVGISLKPDHIQTLQDLLNTATLSQFGNDPLPSASVDIALWLDPLELSIALLNDLDRLHPFGIANPEPIFGLRNATISNFQVFSGQHLRFHTHFAPSSPIQTIAWKLAPTPPPQNTPLDLAVKFSWNHFNGSKSTQLELIDWRLPS